MDKYQIKALALSVMTATQFALPTAVLDHQIPDAQEGVVNSKSVGDVLVHRHVAALKPQVDGVVVALHIGDEYQHHENAEQQEVAAALTEYGADIILGGHPHALEPMKQDKDSFIIYSQGNFFSGQSQMQTRLGGILSLDIKKTEDGVEVASGEFLPTYNEGNYNAGGYKTVPLMQSSLDAGTKQTQFNFVSDLMTSYKSNVKVVESLSH